MKHLFKLAFIIPIFATAQTTDSVYNYLQQIGVKHADIVTKQAILETGHFKSYSCRVRNNLFGLTRNHKLETFDNWMESCHAYKNWIQYKYKGGDYYDFLYELGYASDPKYIQKLNKIVL